MKNLKKSLILVMAFAAITFTFTACSKSGNNDADDAGMEEVVDADATDVDASDAEVTTDSTSTDATDGASTGNYAWSSDLDEWVLNGTGSKTITLSGIAGEGELSAEGRAQLDLIATILESNSGLKAVIQGHSADGGKPVMEKAGSKTRAVWTKTKLIFGHDAVGSNLSTEGLGATQPLEGVDAADESNKRITVSFTK
jgi:outer membrane protein OmpA-like peptidoglycan-associated protein